jgi:thiosulfate/3-mercaptopyruvate sulfurtransferase
MTLACLAALACAAPGAAADSMLVTPAWLAARLHDPRVVVFHIGPRAEYDTAHIAGAQYLELRDLAAPRDSLVPLELPAAAALDSTLEARGVADDSRIVLYWSSQWVSPATRAYLTLVWAGLGDRVSILDGGLAAWRAAGQPVTREVPGPAPRFGALTLRPRSDVVVTAAWVNAHRADPAVAIIDARTPRFYTGEDTSYARPGHIAGAGSLPFTAVVDSGGHFLPRPAIDSLLAAAGASPGELVVTYCHIGQQATAVWFAARRAGREARLYDGSYTEWDRLTDYPVERTAPAEARP